MKTKLNTRLFEFVQNKINLTDMILNSDTGDIFSIIDVIFNTLDINIQISETELRKIPHKNSFIAVANHPFGILDEFIMLKIFSKIRGDFNLLTRYSQSFLTNHENLIFNDNTKVFSKSNLIQAKEKLKNFNSIGILPSERVSSFNPKTLTVSDSKWDDSVLEFLYHTEIPILPVFINGNNSLFFYVKSLINNNILNKTLPNEILNKRNMTIQVRIGSIIPNTEIMEFRNYENFGRYLRSKVYSLGSGFDVQPFYKNQPLIKKKPEAIPSPIEINVLIDEVKSIQEQKCYSQQNFELYISTADKIPNIINEIGRLRELTFRLIGEGTNKSRDLDEFDLYYHHLFLWDNIENRIVGAYRLGKGSEIMSEYGRKGFYTKSLFKYSNKFNPILNQTIELGRSFVVPDYQNKRLPLFMLWKGIMYFILNNPDHRYLLGPVSISNFYTMTSKYLIVEFIKKNHFNHDLAKMIKPKKRFKARIKNIDGESLIDGANSDLFKMDKIISEIEPENYSIPILLKKYIKQNAKIIGFNIDPKFNDALDGLMILDLHELPLDTIETMKKDL